MKKISISIAIAALLVSGCSDKPKETEAETKAQTTTTEVETKTEEVPTLYGVSSTTGADAHSADTHKQNMPMETQHTAIVLESVDAAGYTYAKVDENGQVYWVAGPVSAVAKGDKISFIEQMTMENFTSKALNKTFDLLVFASTLVSVDAAHQAPAANKDHNCDDCGPNDKAKVVEVESTPHGSAHAANNTPKLEKVNVAKISGGYTIEELYSKKDTLATKEIKVNAQVVKVSKNIMQRDWIHIQDGSGSTGTNDMVVTAVNSNVNVGDIVTVSGTLNTNVDFGYGYNYAVLVENAAFTSVQ